MNATSILNRTRFLLRLGAVCAVCTALASPAVALDNSDQDGLGDAASGTITLQVNETDLAQVLEMLAIQSRQNIVTSKSVSGTVSANLFDVTFEEALDAILLVNGYYWEREASFIYVYTRSEWEELQAAMRKRETRVYEMDYLSADDATQIITPLLSEEAIVASTGTVLDGIDVDKSDVGADRWAFSAKVVVTDYPDILDAIGALLEEMDTPPQQVLVEATVIQATLNEANAFGVDFSIIGSVDFTDFTNPLAGVNNLLAGADDDDGFQPADNRAQVGSSTVGNTASQGGLKIGIISNDISVFLRVLDEVTDTTVMARPKIMCLNRQRAEVLVGQRVGYLSTTATETTTTQSVEFLDTGIQLVLRPFINKDGMIRMELTPSVSEASLRDVTDAGGNLVTIPDELTNEVTTNVRVRDGETLILGGLFREKNTITRRQVPILGDVPIIGAVFRGQDDVVDREEIMFLITPNIIQDEVLWEIGNEALDVADAVVVGSRMWLLPFSRSRLTTNYNQDAIEAYNHGDIERALFNANNSLRLNSNQPEMLKFREQVTGQLNPSYERSLLERVLRSKLGPAFEDTRGLFDTPQPEARGVSDEATAARGDWNSAQRIFYSEFMNEFFTAMGMPETSPDFRIASDFNKTTNPIDDPIDGEYVELVGVTGEDVYAE
jgi:type IV pilus assembly protein PilQ